MGNGGRERYDDMQQRSPRLESNLGRCGNVAAKALCCLLFLTNFNVVFVNAFLLKTVISVKRLALKEKVYKTNTIYIENY